MAWHAVIFDLDGTLIDSMGVWEQVDRDFLRKRGIEAPPNLFDDVIGGNSFSEIAIHFKQKFNLTESIEEIMLEWTEMVQAKYQDAIHLKPYVRETLSFLQNRQIKIAIGTSNTVPLTELVLQANGIRDLFPVIIHGGDDIKGKPFPDIFLEAASQLNTLPQHCVVVEDVFVGVQAAKNAGMTVIAIEDDYTIKGREEIKKLADYYAGDFKEILQLFKVNCINI